MAGYDPDAKIYFDGLYNFYKAHPSIINNKLMAWNQVTGCIDDPFGGYDSATDGDEDIAFALLLADKQWGSTGSINYLEEAIAIINAIKQDDVNQDLWTTKLGDWVAPGTAEYDDTRPSDFMMDHVRAFQNSTGDTDWNNVLNESYALVSTMQINFSSVTGLLPDFIVNAGTSPAPAAPNYLEGDYDGDFYYNSCRTPWRIATDYLISGDTRGKNAVQKMNNWIKTKTGNDPTNIYAGYYLNGSNIPGNDYESAAFVGPFAVAAMVDAYNQNWLNDTYEFLLSLELQDYEYYDNTLKLLCMIVLSDNYWVPQGVPGIVNDSYLENFHVNVYPNPFNSLINISVSDLNCKTVTVTISDVLGQIYYGIEEAITSTYLKTIELNFLPGGIYFLIINIDGELVGINIVKQ
jgi:endo-1,4-beta-D-glucanase Y